MTMYYWGKNFGATIVFVALSKTKQEQNISLINPQMVAGFLIGSLVLSFAFFIAGRLV